MTITLFEYVAQAKGDVFSVLLHNMWVTTELLCQCRLRTYKATEEIRKDATTSTKKWSWNESRSKELNGIDINH
jgi:hypothetical protein